ncbi:hypothetical protein [Roseibium sp. Sym1]|uniref:hypothetical protein n=1 Tax=Roseibium sp. Sym1 TaxID=3016006 RepID=UPI0022B31567|nr:hypothetical protein [Roseibium sp. Sym1]
MSLFNRLKIFIKFSMINLETKLKTETFGMFALSDQAKENAFISRMRKGLTTRTPFVGETNGAARDRPFSVSSRRMGPDPGPTPDDLLKLATQIPINAADWKVFAHRKCLNGLFALIYAHLEGQRQCVTLMLKNRSAPFVRSRKWKTKHADNCTGR